ncbi:hypothetical protein C8R46DRAFT_1229177 [Mycena filopes]|nr:hypothetical protein C8R46DRAFT_1229177 [Mycena filopes]
MPGAARRRGRHRALAIPARKVNSKNDRETDGYSAVDYINAITRTLNAQYSTPSYGLAYGTGSNTTFPVSAFITDLVYLEDTSVPVDLRAITAMGVRCTKVGSAGDGGGFDAQGVKQALDGIMLLE